jgi:hypothetical protein
MLKTGQYFYNILYIKRQNLARIYFKALNSARYFILPAFNSYYIYILF